jgi:hypothetical protein
MQPVVQSLVSSHWTADQIGLFLQNTNQSLVLPALGIGQQTATAQGYSEYIVPGPPTLRITNNGAGSVGLGWSPVAVDFLLESKSYALSPRSSWTSISILPRTVGNDFSASIVATNAGEFYRLHQP